MKVIKFGGKVVGDAARIRHAASIVATEAKSDPELWVVVSAIEGVTDGLRAVANAASMRDDDWGQALLEIEQRHTGILREIVGDFTHDQIHGAMIAGFSDLTNLLTGVYALGELSDKVLARILAFGPVWSSNLLTEACKGISLNSRLVDARILIVTDEHFSAARLNFDETRQMIDRARTAETAGISIVPGGIAASKRGLTTDLGRNGSDYSMSIIAAALGASEAQLWTEHPGVTTVDPHRVKDALTIAHMTFEEAMELSHYGAGVLHSATLQPLMDAGIPLRVRCSLNLALNGTVVDNRPSDTPRDITGISAISNMALLRVSGSGMVGVMGIAARLFGVLAANDINVILITQGSSEHSICVGILPCDIQNAIAGITREFSSEIARRMIDPPAVEEERCVLSVVGENMRRRPGLSGRLFSALGENGINVIAIAQGSSELNISVVIARSDEDQAIGVIHRTFFK